MSTAGPSEHRYLFLDGLRGIAALCVAIFHAALLFGFGYIPRHAVLAVDLFFCLSGFVIACAYDDRLHRGLSARQFMVSRVIRLYPMILIAVLFGGAVLVGHNLSAGHSAVTSVLLTVASLVLFPLGLMLGMQAYPPNDPLWSLFFELAANAGYGLFGKRLSRVLSWGLLLLCAALLVRAVRWAHGIAEIGFADYKYFTYGFVRVGFPFLAGALLYRGSVRRSLPSVLCGTAVVLVLLGMLLNDIPLTNLAAYDLTCALLVIPALIYIGARIRVVGHAHALCTWSGSLSYPFYLLHGPTFYLVRDLARSMHIDRPLTVAFVALLLAGLLAQAILRFYDEPVRAWLSRRRRQRSASLPAGGAA